MKYDVNTYSNVEVTSSMGDTNITLAKGSESLIFQIFSKNIYSNPIGSVVREITSNCFDSHVEAGVDLPVIIRKNVDKVTGNKSISFIDYGVGMSPERIKDVFSVMFNSTKRDDNLQIGAFGLGSKTPLAYKRSTGQGEGEYDNSYTIITNYNGFKYTYHIYDGNKCPKITEPSYEITTDRNGTEIQVPVLEKDIESFQKEMIKQLYYFENIVFEGFDYPHAYNKDEDGNSEIVKPLDNDYQIIRGKSFLFRGDKYGSHIHVCLGRVAYPIDFDILGLDSDDYSLPIALKLKVGDINVIASRENIDYSEVTIKILKKKLEEAKEEISKLINKQYKSIKTLEQYFSVKHDFGKLIFSNGASLYVGDLIKQKDIDFSNFKYQFMKMPNDRQLFKFFFDAQTYGKKPRKSRWRSNDNEFEGGYKSLKSRSNLVYVDGEFKRKIIKQAYLKEEYETYYIIKKRDINSNWIRKDIADLFNVHIDSVENDEGTTTDFVQSLIEMQEEYFEIVRKHTKNYDTLEVPEDFVASRKRGAGITLELRKLTIPVKFVGGYSKDRVKLSVLFDYKMPIFYGTANDYYLLINAMRLYSVLFDNDSIVTHCDYNENMQTGRNGGNKYKKSITFIQLAVNNVKYMKHCKKAKHVSQFFLTMLPRKEAKVMQYFQTNIIIEKYKALRDFYTNGFINRVNDKWGKKADAIKVFVNAIPENIKDSGIKHHKSLLEQYFKLSDIKQTKEQLKIIRMIKKIEQLEENNNKTLGYFNIPYKAEQMEDELITLLELAMTF